MSVAFRGFLTDRHGVELEHGPSGAKISTSPPADNGGTGDKFSPTDLCASSLGACATTIMSLFCQANGIALSGISFEVEKQMATSSPRRIGAIKVSYLIASNCSDEDFERIVAAGRTCPVRLSLNPDVKVEETYRRAGEA